MKPHRFDNLILIGLFVAGSFLYFDLHYRYWYHFMEQFVLFLYTNAYFTDLIHTPGGFTEYLNGALMQFFVLPHVAPAILALVSGLIAVSALLFYRRCGYLFSALWCLVPGFLFWIFPPESLSVPLSLLTGLVVALGYTYSLAGYRRFLLAAGLLTACYLLAAPAHLLAACLMGFYEISKPGNKQKFVTALAFLAFALLLPLLAMRTLFVVPMEEAFFSRYLYHPEYPQPLSFRIIGCSLPLLSILLYGLRKWQSGFKYSRSLCYLLLTGGIALGILYGSRPIEQTYRYDYYARTGNWQKIIDHAGKHPVKDLNALVYLNLALSHTNQLGNRQFDFPQAGVSGLIPQDPVTRLDLIAASEVAWQIGHINSSQRYAFVGVLSSERRVQSRLMTRLVETYLVNEEYGAAQKYITILENTLFYRDWARKMRALLKEDTAVKTPWITEKRKVNVVTDNPFDPAKALPNALGYLLDDHPDNRPALEYALSYLLLYKDLTAFMQYMQSAQSLYTKLPIHYQEAICIYYATVESNPEAFSSYGIDRTVYERFIKFCSVAGNGPKALHQEFGNTYYYYAQFEETPQRN